MVAHDHVDALLARRQHVEPEQHGPQPVLLAHMVRAGAGRFLAADGDAAGIEQVAEELPAGRRLVHLDAELLGHPIGSGAGRHRAGNAGDSGGIARRMRCVGGEDGERIRRRDEAVAADDQVAVAIAIRGRAEIRRVVAHHQVVQILGVDQVRVGVPAAEIRRRRAVDHGALGRAEQALEDLVRVGAGHRVHGVETHGEARGEHGADLVEIEQALHQRRIVCDRIDHLHHHAGRMLRADAAQVDIGRVDDQVAVDFL